MEDFARPEVIEIEECSEDMLNELEMFYIAYFRMIGCNLTNMTDGATGRRGFVDDEHRRKFFAASIEASHRRKGTKNPKISEANKGRVPPNKGKKMSDDQRDKISVGLMGNNRALGHRLSDEAKERIASKLRGRRQSAEIQAKRSASLRAFHANKKQSL